MHLVGNIVIALALAGLFAGGIALFTIARQDDSRLGQLIGAAAVLAAAAAAAYFGTARHWF